jgi:Zn-dependent protease
MTAAARCAGCATELPPGALACPACAGLVHAQALRDLAHSARAHEERGDLESARDTWQRALALLPAGSGQHRHIADRLAEITRRMAAPQGAARAAGDVREGGSWWRRGLGGAAAGGSLLLGKLKFLALGLMKAKTALSMLAFFGVYWTTFGWPLALGLVLSIYIHEMGHVAILRQLGIAADAPLFIPGVGALVMLRQHIADPVVDARIGLAGPVWGLGAGLGALAVAVVTGSPTWRAVAELTGFINLFNLIPIWQLDGSRGFHALSQQQRWAIAAIVALAFVLTGQLLLLVIAAVAVFRSLKATPMDGDARTFATFAGLVAALSWLARHVG